MTKSEARAVALVTGASRGIGKAITHALAARGLTVAMIGRDEKVLENSVNEISELNRSVRGYACDASKSSDVSQTFERIRADLGVPSVLVNNAGYGGPFHTINEVTDEEWEEIIGVNLKSAFLFSRELLPAMKQTGFGRVINISSVQGLHGERAPDHLKSITDRIPSSQKLGTPEDIASAVAFLASSEAAYVNGSIWTIDGGYSTHLGSKLDLD